MRAVNYLLLLLVVFLAACGGSTKELTLDNIYEEANIKELPPAEDYKQYGAVILYENTESLSSIENRSSFMYIQKKDMAFVYYNDKAEDMLTQTLLIDANQNLTEFSATVYNPSGEIIKLGKEILYPMLAQDNMITFSDNKSVKFTFPGVQPGSVIRYTYTIEIPDALSLMDTWYIQSSVPKLTVSYKAEIPGIISFAQVNWRYFSFNFKLDKPKISSEPLGWFPLDASITYSWRLNNIEALINEPNAGPYSDIGQYAIIGISGKRWSYLSSVYWNLIQDHFNHEDTQIKTLADSLVVNASTMEDSISAIYNYTQKEYRYVAVNIGQSGFIPNYPQDIINNKYGDCKDMTVLNTVLLRSLGFKAYPVLVKTRSAGIVAPEIVAFDFNHMITKVETDKKDYWLDAVGSICPLNEIYSEVEGTNALLITGDKNGKLERIPISTYKDNRLKRKTELYVDKYGNSKGHTTLTLVGEENLEFRTLFKDATEKDMHDFTDMYMLSSSKEIKINNIKYDSLSAIKDTTSIDIDFDIPGYGVVANNLLIINPFIIDNKDNLEIFRDVERKTNIIFPFGRTVEDEVEIYFEDENMSLSQIDLGFSKDFPFAKIAYSSFSHSDNSIRVTRRIALTERTVYKEEYKEFREYLKVLNKLNKVNLMIALK